MVMDDGAAFRGYGAAITGQPVRAGHLRFTLACYNALMDEDEALWAIQPDNTVRRCDECETLQRVRYLHAFGNNWFIRPPTMSEMSFNTMHFVHRSVSHWTDATVLFPGNVVFFARSGLVSIPTRLPLTSACSGTSTVYATARNGLLYVMDKTADAFTPIDMHSPIRKVVTSTLETAGTYSSRCLALDRRGNLHDVSEIKDGVVTTRCVYRRVADMLSHSGTFIVVFRTGHIIIY